ncbi:tetratricopeptide repeat protein [Chloroflexi bacterium TSY]|nr:tetratricopeptide repeat protein [Chloroflexi bacterium TSY]MBV7329364.1 tetratricopeptide repeat protein [Chloroflexi bacterium TSY]
MSEDDREQALHVLSYAFKIPEAWPYTRDLLLTMAPKMEQAGFREEWIPYLKQGIEQSRFLNDPPTEAELNHHLGLLHQFLGHYDEARKFLTISSVLFKELNHLRNQAKVINRLAYIARIEGCYEEANSLVRTALTLLDEEDIGRGFSYFVLGSIALDEREWQFAENYFRQSLAFWEKEGDERKIAWGLRNLGPSLRAQERYDEAITCYRRAIELLENIQDPVEQAATQVNLGVIYSLQGQPDEALRLYELAEIIFRQTNDELRLARTLVNKGIDYRNVRQWKYAESAYLSSISRSKFQV